MKKAENNKIKIAAIKFGGLAAGGTEKALQTIMANLPKEQFEVDYFYCDAAPYFGSDYKHADTDPARLAYMKSKNVNLIKFNMMFKDVTKPTHPWLETNFWDLFDENKYDIIQSARAGHAEYPFTNINKTAQVDLITLPGMAERKQNVVKVVHISQFQADTWMRAGGEPGKVEIIPLFDELKEKGTVNLRKQLKINDDVMVYGLHQRDDDGIFSQVPLFAYSRIETDKTAFILLGGSKKYVEQAKELNIKNFYHLEHTGDSEVINEFLNTLNVYAHGRADGETFSLAIAEAMYHGLPIVSHTAPAMGHKETIGSAGYVAESMDQYVALLQQLITDKMLYEKLSKNAESRFKEFLSLEKNIEKWVKIYTDVLAKKKEDDMPAEEFWENMWQ
jgi:glycosyltransferase involved in cell wall biosynthesis